MKRLASCAAYLVAMLLSGNASAQHLQLPGVAPKPHQSMICVDCQGDGGGGGGSGGGSSGPSKVIYHKVDSVEHTAEMHLDNGAIMVIDYPLNKVFISGGGHTAELSLDAVLLQKANGNTQLANSLKSQLHDQLYQTGLMVDMQAASGSPTLMKRAGTRRTRNQGLMVGPSDGYGYSCYFDWYCYERSFSVPDWGMYDAGFWGLETQSGGYGNPDYNYWDIWRNDHCDSMQSEFAAAGASVVTMAVGCAFFETGIGAVACAAGGIGVYMSMDAAAKDAAVCLSNYPGYGNWGH